MIRRLMAWYRRRFRGYVAPRGEGTAWQEHRRGVVYFKCRCGESLYFATPDLFVREREHRDDCALSWLAGMKDCYCPIVSARYCKICPRCNLGHWKDGTPK